MSFARRDWFSESARLHEREVKTLADVVAKGKSRIASARGKKAEGRERGGAAASSSSPNTSGYLGAAKSVALMPVKAGNAAATQVRVLAPLLLPVLLPPVPVSQFASRGRKS